MNTDGTNTAQSTSAIAISAEPTSFMLFLRGLARRQPGRDVALDVFDHDDGVIDHDADRQHQPEQATDC